MFKSVSIIKNEVSGFSIKLIDTEFSLNIYNGNSTYGLWDVLSAVASIYEEKKMNVSLNITLIIRSQCYVHAHTFRELEINWNKLYPQHVKYIPDIALYFEIMNAYPEDQWERVKQLKAFL